MKTNEIQNKVLEIIKIFDNICRENNIWYTLTSGSVLGAVRHGGFIPWDTDMDVFIKITDLRKIREILLKKLPKNMKLYIWELEPKYPLCFDRLSFIDSSHYSVHLDIFPLIGAPQKIKDQIRFTRLCYYSYKLLRTKHVDVNYSKPENRKKIKVLKVFTKLIPDWLIRKWYNYLQYKYSFENSEFVYTIASGYGMKECLPKKLLLETKYVKFEDTKLPIPVRYHEYLTRVYGDYMTPKKDGYKGCK